MPKKTKLAKEIIKEIPKYNRCGIYEVRFGSFSDSRKQVYLVEADKVKNEFKGTIKKNVCFRGLDHELKDKGLNRVYMAIEDCTKALPRITPKEKKQWIELAQKYKLLPEYVKQSWVDKGEYIIDLRDKNMSPSLLYAYLSIIRCNRDEPGFVRSVLIMVDHGVNYYIAFALASKMYITNSGHHIINVCRRYPYMATNTTKAIFDMDLEIGVAISLRRYFDNPKKWDKRDVISKPGQSTNQYLSRWGCHDNIRATTKINTKTKASNLYSPLIIKAIMSDSDGEANKHLQKLK